MNLGVSQGKSQLLKCAGWILYLFNDNLNRGADTRLSLCA
jgi:hypothetical protein